MKKIGIIGYSGRVGKCLKNFLIEHSKYQLGIGYNSSSLPQCLLKVFQDNDFVIDFSSSDLIKDILNSALQCPKPLILCSTGWEPKKIEAQLHILSRYVPIVIAPNTSLGACLQKYLAYFLSHFFSMDYEIDIIEKHHRYKVDFPSGTTKSLLESIFRVKKDFSLYHLNQGKRTDKQIGVSSIRSGNIIGEHELSFTSEDELVSIKHVVFNRNLFAKGALKVIDWLEESNPQPGIYGMEDVFSLS